ncbi:MAG: PAS domain S-box protein, partial [Planctomycetes bacterium]|nr:PAS domain S-box protein [Planctomycetota bacterium]
MSNSSEPTSPLPLLHAALPDMFANLQTAYAELTRTEFELERRAAELEEARDLFQQVIESMSEALFLMDRTGRVLRTNRAAGTLLDCDSAALAGRPFEQVWGNHEIPTTPWRLLERAPNGKLTNLDVELRRSAGRVIPISISCGLVRDKRGKVTGVLAVARDITDRKRAEEERARQAQELARQAEELARSNADLDQFAYIASHDLREPLRTVASYTQRLEKLYQGQLDAVANDCIDRVIKGARLMDRLIDDLYTYSRVGRQGNKVPTDCSAIFAAVSANLKAAIEEAGAAVTAETLPIVMGVETELVRLFQNLIGNAVKFRGDRPIQVHVGAQRQGDDWLFSVLDNGIGIEPQYWKRIFGIGERLHSKTKYPGTGFGLAICQKIVEHHGG